MVGRIRKMNANRNVPGRPYRENQLRVSVGKIYMYTAEDLPTSGSQGETTRARVYHSTDGGTTWDEVPLKLAFRSKLLGLLTSWPPEFIDEMRLENGILSFTFHDQEYPDANPILPFK